MPCPTPSRKNLPSQLPISRSSHTPPSDEQRRLREDSTTSDRAIIPMPPWPSTRHKKDELLADRAAKPETLQSSKNLANGKPSKLKKPPKKPYNHFPLFAHASGQWAKKIGAETCYFGPWDSPEKALAAYEEAVGSRRPGATCQGTRSLTRLGATYCYEFVV